MKVTIGWTLNSRSDRSYSSFCDGYQAGRPQHRVTFNIDDSFDHVDPSTVAEAAFGASNALGAGFSPRPGLETAIGDGILASGYDGRVPGDDLVGHFSLSIGDTVTVQVEEGRAWGSRMMLACETAGWRIVEPQREFRYTVTVSGCTEAQADQVMAERIYVDEDYGFDYRIDFEKKEE